MTQEKLYLVDASAYIFRSYYAIRNMTNPEGLSTGAIYGFVRSMHKIIKDFNPKYLLAVFDPKDGRKKRSEIYPQYKAHRQVPEDIPRQIQWSIDFCRHASIPYLVHPGAEADDAMGTVCKLALDWNLECFMCSSDKDLAQLVNEKVSIIHTHKDNFCVDSQEVEKIYGVKPSQITDLLALVGDSSDNVPGVTGIGMKTAVSLLHEFGSLDFLLAHPEKVKGKKKQEALLQEADKARLARELVTIDTHLDLKLCKEDLAFVLQPKSPHLEDFYRQLDFRTLLDAKKSELLKTNAQEDYRLVDSYEALEAFLRDLEKNKSICIDTETDAIHPMEASLVGIGFSWEEGLAYYLPMNGSLGMDLILQRLKPILEDSKRCFFGHNIKYDYHVLKNHRIELKNISFDTMVASYLLNAHSHRHSLDVLAQEVFQKEKISIKELIGTGKKSRPMSEVSIKEVCTYCCEDVDYTLRLKNHFEQKLKERALLDLLEKVEMPLLKILAAMERVGVFLNVDLLKDMSLDLDSRIGLIQSEVFELAGKHFNLSSPKQLSEVLYCDLGMAPPKKTKTGFSTNAQVLESLKDQYPIAGKILEYRSLEKLRSTYIDALPHDINATSGRIHCTFNQSVAATGRLSCQNPNLQNIPIRTKEGRKIRQAFCPQQAKWSYIAADYSQIELRLLAHLSEDENLIQAFQSGEDIHRATAALIFNLPQEKVTKEQRYQAKTVNFGVIYGQQAFGLSKELGISVQDAAFFIKMYFSRYPKVEEFIEKSKEQAKESSKSITLTGRERFIPDIKSKNKIIRQAAERLAVNTPLQGTAADLIKMAMLGIDKEVQKRRLKGNMVLQIHDEILCEVPDDELSVWSAVLKKEMESVFHLKVPLIVNVNVGKNWSEC